MVGIVVISCGHFPFTKKCIESILKHTPRDLYRLCLVDNGSQDQTKGWAKELYNLGYIHRFIDNKKNIGACRAANQGTVWVLDNHYDNLIVANDHVVTDTWLEPILDAPFDHVNPFVFYSVKFFRELGGIGQILDKYKGIRVKYLQDDSVDLDAILDLTYRGFGGLAGFAKKFTNRYKDDPYRKVNMTQWPGFVYYRNKVVEDVGLRDEEFLKFTLAGYADIDYQYRVFLKRYTVGIVKTSFVHHWGSITTRKNGLKSDSSRFENSDFDISKRNPQAAIEYLKKKHGLQHGETLESKLGQTF